jgi:alkylated DNA repair dioxygenase AlkB
MPLPDFERLDLDEGHCLWLGRVPEGLVPNTETFEALWQMHPEDFHEIKMYGRLIKTPRWQQAYGKDYHYTGRVNKAKTIPPLLEPFLDWSREHIDLNLNGLLLNWYEGRLGHYIGPHRDSVANLVLGTPIVTISFGEERTFRLRRAATKLKATPIDIPALNGSVFVMPWETNRAFTHEVPCSSRHVGRRISVTLRGFVKTQND